MSISIIDFSDNSKHCETMDKSLREKGFVQVKNIGIDKALLEQAFQLSRKFFAGSHKVKSRSAYLSAYENFGYQGLQQEYLDPSAPAYLKEAFTMRNILIKCPEDSRWPNTKFRELMQAFYKNAVEASFTARNSQAP